jgi:uncharacterized protein YjdB
VRVALACRAAILPALLACGGESTAPAATVQVTVEFPVAELEVGQTSVATVFVTVGTRREVVGNPVLTSQAPTVATISPTGELLAIAAGTATISATARGGRSEFTVRVVPVRAAHVAIAPGDSAIDVGTTIQLTASVRDAANVTLPGRLVTWRSSDSTIATVSGGGEVRARALGVATISATSDGASGQVALRVRDPATSATTVSIQPARTLLVVGDSVQLTAIVRDGQGNQVTDRPVAWSLSTSVGSAVARLSPTGLLHADSVGSIIVEALAEGHRTSLAVRIVRDVDSSIVVNFARPLKDGLVGDTLKILVSVDHPVPIASVVAILGVRRIELQREFFGFNGLQEGWAAVVDVSLLKYGPYQLDVVVTDILGALGTGSQRFTRDATKNDGGSPPPGPRSK